MQNKVNFFIIGQPKTGTTSLYFYLKQHPKIFLPSQKQLYHFAEDHNKHRKKFKKFQKKYYSNYYNYDLKTYLDRFDFKKEYDYYADITPDYFYSKSAPEKIYKYNPDANIIAIIREPLDFLKSFHLQMVNSNNEYQENFGEALKLEEERLIKKIKQNKYCPPYYFKYSQLINYKKFIDKYYNIFGNRFKLIVYEDFKNNNMKYLEYIYKFLGLDIIIPNKKIVSNVSRKKNNLITKIKGLYFFRFFSSLLTWKLKNFLKQKFSIINITKKTNKNYSFDDFQYRKEIKKKILNINSYLLENNLYLGNNKIDLVKFWGYDKID